MQSKIVISGTGCLSDFAQTSRELIENVSRGQFVDLKPVFENKMLRSIFGFEYDVKYAPMEGIRKEQLKNYKSSAITDGKVAALINVTEQVLQDAKLEISELASSKARVFWGSSGNHPDLLSFVRQLHGNQSVDLLLNPKIKELHADSFRNDTLTQPYADYFKLANPILTVSSACSSALNAMIPAMAMLRSGAIDRALVLSWQEVSKFDILFMSGINIMSKQASLPFSKQSDGITPAFGVSGLLLERLDHDQKGHDDIAFSIKSISSRRALSGSAHSVSMDVSFRAITQTMQDALDKAGVDAKDVDVIFPHGNGIPASDQSEVSALTQMFSHHKAQIASYTEQTGYLLSASGGFDLILAKDAFENNRVLPIRSKGELDLTKDLNFTFENNQTDVRYLLKNSIGIDGSIVSCLLERVDHE